MKKRQNIGVVLLAAGQSSRMCGIKQLLPWKDTFLLQHCLNTLLKINAANVVVVLGANAEKIKLQLILTHGKTEIVENPDWKMGLGKSISSGVQKLMEINAEKFEGILVCLADQPLITDEYLRNLISEFKSSNHSIIASKYKNRVGVPAVFSASVFNELLDLNSDYGAKKIIENYTSSLLAMDADAILVDVDTPKEYDNLYRLHHEEKL